MTGATKPKILIGVPAYKGWASECVGSLITLAVELSRHYAFAFAQNEVGDIEKARNALASFALNKGFTHICMIDSDMVFAPAAVLKMIRANRDVIACNAPLRQEADKLVFSAIYHDDKSLEADGTMKVKRIGTGIILIKTTALARLAATGQIRRDTSSGEPVYGFFDKLTNPDGSRIGEDYSFCDRWRTLCGGEIFAVIDEPIGHINKTMHRAMFLDYLDVTPMPLRVS
jgi:hypothetical protein